MFSATMPADILDLISVHFNKGAKRIQVKGKATDADGIYEITINGIEANVSENGSFTADVPLKYGKNDLVVKATDLKQASSTKTFI